MSKNKQWSSDLLFKTRKYLASIIDWAMFSDNLCLKNLDNRFATISLKKIGNEEFDFVDRTSGNIYSYETIDDVIADGWAVD